MWTNEPNIQRECVFRENAYFYTTNTYRSIQWVFIHIVYLLSIILIRDDCSSLKIRREQKQIRRQFLSICNFSLSFFLSHASFHARSLNSETTKHDVAMALKMPHNMKYWRWNTISNSTLNTPRHRITWNISIINDSRRKVHIYY